MVKIDLVTGFLGAGKTTFIKKYAAALVGAGTYVGILENDLGAINVDMMLMQDLRGDHCELEMVAGGCDADCHKRRFKTKLISMAMSGYDRVIVEPSGIYDVDEFFDTLREEPLDQWYEIGSVITIVDACLEELSEEARYLLASQIAGSGQVILSGTEGYTKEHITGKILQLNEILAEFGCKRVLNEDVITKPWSNSKDEDFLKIAQNGTYHPEFYVNRRFTQNSGFTSLYFLNMGIDSLSVMKAAMDIFANQKCGNVFRIKGFAKDAQGMWEELNIAGKKIKNSPIAQGQEAVIVIGENMCKDQIAGIFQSYGANVNNQL